MSHKISVRAGSDNIFRDLGFSEGEAQEAEAKHALNFNMKSACYTIGLND